MQLKKHFPEIPTLVYTSNMATVATIKNEMHRASCAELLTLKVEADIMVDANPALLPWFTNHVYREYNKKRFFECGASDLISNYDGGFRPVIYNPSTGEALLLENDDYILLENDGFILLE